MRPELHVSGSGAEAAGRTTISGRGAVLSFCFRAQKLYFPHREFLPSTADFDSVAIEEVVDSYAQRPRE